MSILLGDLTTQQEQFKELYQDKPMKFFGRGFGIEDWSDEFRSDNPKKFNELLELVIEMTNELRYDKSIPRV